MTRPELIRSAGRLLYGHHWRVPLMMNLLPYKPVGSSLDVRRITHWALGSKTCPDWALRALPELFAARRESLISADAREILRAVRAEVGR
jgi:hypothetical protein